MRYYKLLLIPLLCLCGCRLGPKYEVPEVSIPENWKSDNTIATPAPNVNFWWEIFGDETLNTLEEEVINNNLNLYVAFERVVEARALAGVSNANLYPQLNFNPYYSDTGIFSRVHFSKALASDPQLSTLTRHTIIRIQDIQYKIPLNLSYEIDLWGKLHGQFDSAFFTAEAQADAYWSLLLSLTTDLAQSYFQLRSLDGQLDVLQATVETRRKSFELNQNRFNKGLVTNLDVYEASLDLTNAEATYLDTLRQRKLIVDQIAVLIGKPAPDFSLDTAPLKGHPPEIPAGIPAQVLTQRPDIAQAERNIASQHALIGVAYASFFPSLSLTGSLGYSSLDLTNFIKLYTSTWMLGANAAQSIFDAGRNYSNLEVAWARFHEASGSYQQQVLVAFQEVEDALNNLEMEEKQLQKLAQSVHSSSQSAAMSTNRYQNGLVTYLQVMDAQRSQLQAQLNYVNLLGLQYISTVQLIKTLGGSWEVPSADCSTTESSEEDEKI